MDAAPHSRPHLRGQTPESLAALVPGFGLGPAQRALQRLVGEDGDHLDGVRGLSRVAAAAPTGLPARSPSRGPPYWKSRVLRRMALGDNDDRGQLLPAERAFGYHDAARGDYRMQVLRELIPELVGPGEAVAIAR